MYGLKQPVSDWPHIGYNFVPAMKQITGNLVKNCPDFEFTLSTASDPEHARAILELDKSSDIDGYLICQMNSFNPVVKTIAASGKPVLYADFKYGGSGGFLVYTAGFLRSKTSNVGFVASSRIEDLVEAVKCFKLVVKGGSTSDFVVRTAQERLARTPKPGNLSCAPDKLKTLSPQECLAQMKESKILAVHGQKPLADGEIMGIKVLHIPFAEINGAYMDADKDESCAIADRWQKTATSVKDVTRKTLEQSAAMYLGIKTILKKHRADAITINCLDGFYGKHIQAYPCLGFHELNNEGLVGTCECDVRSAATMVAITALTKGRPGYISDPVIDTSKRQIIYAHCVASNRVFGPQGEPNAFHILTHSEDRQGASVRSILPLGYMTTTLQFDQSRKEILFHQGKTVANDSDDRGCRTKLVVEPKGDMEKLFTMWDRWGWHRVTFYGDLKEPVYALADALGWKVIEEA